jgi:hypothetical protein
LHRVRFVLLVAAQGRFQRLCHPFGEINVSYLDDDSPATPSSRPAKPPRTSGKAIASLVLGVASIALCLNVLAGIPAIAFGRLARAEIRRGRGKLTGDGLATAGIVTGVIGSTVMLLLIAVALILPAVGGARTAARRNASTNNLKQVGLALQNFHDVHKKIPAAATRDEAGNPLLSWRVAILPYMEEAALFKKFNQDEPWNGPTNQTLAANEPPPYISPGGEHAPAETNVYGIVGPDTVLTPEGGPRFRDVRDGLSRTIVAVELAGGGVAWSEPRDITIEEFVAAVARQPSAAGLRPCYSGVVICLYGDGGVRSVPMDTPPEVLRALCTRDGGEAVEIPGLE